jgi:DNA-3-methyladenine glycosylase
MKKRSGTEESLITLQSDFYTRDVLDVAPELIGKILIITPEGSPERRFCITEVEAYRGREDKACHASKGRTARTEIMFHEGGRIYVYFVYGMYWMLNIVTGKDDDPQAVLIRGVEGITGPGRVTRELGIDGSFYGEDLSVSGRIKIADNGKAATYITQPRVGIDYAGEPWKSKHWRYLIRY